jgi:hypothetical protein
LRLGYLRGKDFQNEMGDVRQEPVSLRAIAPQVSF